MLALTACGSLLLTSGCDTAKTRETANQVRAETVNPRVQLSINNLEAMEKNGIVVTPYTSQRSMGEAQMRIRQPEPGQVVPAGAVSFTCDVSNFRLGTAGTAPDPGLTVSPLGQSITTIIDNEVINEHDKPTFTESLTEGSHVVLSFLTRATREALKHRTAYDLRVVNVGNSLPKGAAFNPKAPAIFYNLPRGTYTGDEADKILLDFVVANATLEEEGTSVRLTINKTPFTLSRWAAYVIEGLPMGPCTIQLELIDADGHLIPGPFNDVTRTITLRPGA